MSLINEALKRTRDASSEAGAARPQMTEAYRISSSPSRAQRRVRPAFWISLIVVTLVGSAAAFVTTQINIVPEPVPPVRVKVRPPTRVPVPAPEPVAPPEPPPVVVPEPPKLVLQGITADPHGREAMINGMNLREGDDIDGVKVLVIEARRVKLQFGDREIVLRMP